MALTLTKVAETGSTITLGWTASAEYDGFVFYANGQAVSVATARDKNGVLRKEVKFSKTSPGPPFEVAAVKNTGGVISVESAKYTTSAPLPPNTSRSAQTPVVT